MKPLLRLRIRFMAWMAVAFLAGLVSAQTAGDRGPDDAIESFLATKGLDTLLATHLRDRLSTTSGEERQRVAERLGDLYARLHADAATSEERASIEALGYELMREVPDSESFSLRLNLAKARYIAAEEIAERYRIRLATDEERAEAVRSLRTVGATFEEIGNRVQVQVEALERAEQRANANTDTRETRRKLDRARRERSLARFYAGWTKYYLALLEQNPSVATSAPTDFGWLLGTPGRPAAVERAPKALLKYEHIARAALGCAMVAAVTGNDAESERWFDLLQTAPDVPESVLSQVFTRKLVVYAGAQRWSDLDRLVALRVRETGQTLGVSDARLLAVLVLEAGTERSTIAGRDQMIESLAQAAFKALIARGELGQIVDLVNRYGTTPIGGAGFVPEYVRAVKAYDRALESHKQAGGTPDEPAVVEEIVIQFRDAAALLSQATKASDAAAFAKDRDRALVLAGVALFLSGQFEASADRLEEAAGIGLDPARREEAMWLAIASLDRAVDGDRPSLAPRRDKLAMLYLEQFPTTERAAKLLLRRAGEGLLPDDQAAAILMAISPESPVYHAARRYASRLLYRVWRSARADAKGAAGRAFLDVANEMLQLDLDEIASADAERSARAAAELMIRERQVLDVVMSVQEPDLTRATQAIENVTRAAGGRDRLGDVRAELAYRQLQIGLATGDSSQIAAAADELAVSGGRFAEAGDRLLYRRAVEDSRASPGDVAALRRVVAYGSRLVERTGSKAESLSDPVVFGVHDTVAAASAEVWRQTGDVTMRDRALAIDRAVCEANLATSGVLRRRAELSEAAGLLAEASDSWRSLLAGHREGTTDWYESRYNSLRLLMLTDVAEAKRAFDQFAVLHPDMGPPPWNERFALLKARLDDAPIPSDLPSEPGRDGAGGGGPP